MHAPDPLQRRLDRRSEGELLRRDRSPDRFRSLSGDPAPRRHDRQPSDRPPGRRPPRYFPSGTWEYTKAVRARARRRRCRSRSSSSRACIATRRVRVNDTLAAHRPCGYSDFTVQIDHLLRFGEPNEIKVEARAHDDSRWYSGAGIYRSVWLLRGPRVHLVPGGLQVSTPEIDDDVAVVAVAWRCGTSPSDRSRRRPAGRGARPDGTVVAGAEAPVTTVPGDVLDGAAAALRPGAASLGSRRSLPLHLPGHPAGRTTRSSTRRSTHLRDPLPVGSTRAGPAHQRGAGPAAGRLRAPRQRPARCGHHRPGRGAPGRAAQSGRVQRHPERPQPLEQADARRL